jgi:hypothetical protein
VPRWQKQKYKLPANHGWRGKPGYKIFVADRGAVRFNVPESWHFDPEAKTATFRDLPPPDDNCLLQITVMYLNPTVDWSGLPLPQVFEQVLRDDSRGPTFPGPPQYVKRANLELVWHEVRLIDPAEKRESISVACLARAETVLPLITMDYWPEQESTFRPVWDEVLRSLQLNDRIDDLSGPKLH